MKKQILALGFVLFTCMLPFKAAAQKIDRIYTFGDSFSDPGNEYNAILKLTKQAFLPPPYYKGRFSNGIVWVEYLGQQLGLNPTPVTNLPIGSFNAPNGVNYAFGGASSGYKNAVDPRLPLPGVLAQINLYTASLAATKQSADPNAIYIVFGGADDYLFGKVTDPQVPVNNLLTGVKALVAVGARKIIVANVGDLGKFPATRGNSQISNQLSALSRAHNSLLAKQLSSLKVFPRASIVLLDVYTLFNTALTYPKSFGFTNVTDACLTDTTLCANPNQYLFWDGYHPTTAGHRQIELFAYTVIQNYLFSKQLNPSKVLPAVKAYNQGSYMEIGYPNSVDRQAFLKPITATTSVLRSH